MRNKKKNLCQTYLETLTLQHYKYETEQLPIDADAKRMSLISSTFPSILELKKGLLSNLLHLGYLDTVLNQYHVRSKREE